MAMMTAPGHLNKPSRRDGRREPKTTGGLFRRLSKARAGPFAWIVYAVVRTVFAVMQIFPLDWNLRTARLGARIWPHLMPRHRKRAVEHLTAAFADTLTDEEINRLADRCLENVAMFAVEVVCLPRLITSLTWNRYIDLCHFDDAVKIVLEGRGGIFVTGHYGPFEISAHLLAVLGFDLVAVMRPLDNEYLNRFIVGSRKTRGLKLLDKKGATAQAQALLEEGYLVSFVGDQDAGRKGLFVDFFGQPASTYKSIGLLAMATGRPIMVGYARRLGNTARYEVGVQRVIRPDEWADKEDPLRWITQSYTSAIEQIVRVDSQQYLWIHRRWKSKPKTANRAATGTAKILTPSTR